MPMLSLFPQILFLAPLGTAIIRIAAGITFLYLAHFYFYDREAVSRTRVPVIGQVPQWLLIVGSIIMLGTGAALVVGAWTQLAALIGAVAALKCSIFAKRYPVAVPLSTATSLLLLAITLCLLVSDAGAFSISVGGLSFRTAFDLPL